MSDERLKRTTRKTVLLFAFNAFVTWCFYCYWGTPQIFYILKKKSCSFVFNSHYLPCRLFYFLFLISRSK